MSGARRGILERLDDWAVPALGGGLRRAGRAARASGRVSGPVGRWVIGFSRRQPVVVAAVLMVAAAGVLWGITGGDRTKAVRPAAASVGPALSSGDPLGPAPGSTVSAYLAAAALRRQQLAALPGSQRLNALLDLTGYLTPQAISTLLAAAPDVQIRTGFARVAPPDDAAVHVLTTSVGGDLAAQLGADQAEAKQDLTRYSLALSAHAQHPRSAQLNALIAAQEPKIPAARVDAKGLGPQCACVFALEVNGPVSQLEQIAGLTDVRTLDPAPQTGGQLMVVPLEPQVTGTIQPLQFAND
jgi:hypothetical protein